MWDRLSLKGKFLRENIIKYQNWLPEEVIDLPGSEDFKTCILMLLLEEILWSRQLGKKKETGLSVPGEPPDVDSPKSGPNLLHVLILYFSICSMGKVKTHCTALDNLGREVAKIFPPLHVWPGTLWLAFPWLIFLASLRHQSSCSCGNCMESHCCALQEILSSPVEEPSKGLAGEHYSMPRSMQVISCDIEKEISKGPRG